MKNRKTCAVVLALVLANECFAGVAVVQQMIVGNIGPAPSSYQLAEDGTRLLGEDGGFQIEE